MVSKEQFEEFLSLYDFKKDEAKPFNAVIDGLKLHFVNSNELNILSFPQSKEINSLITNLGSPISKANL